MASFGLFFVRDTLKGYSGICTSLAGGALQPLGRILGSKIGGYVTGGGASGSILVPKRYATRRRAGFLLKRRLV